MLAASSLSTAQFDYELVEVLQKASIAYIQQKEKATASEVRAPFLHEAGFVRWDARASLRSLRSLSRALWSRTPLLLTRGRWPAHPQVALFEFFDRPYEKDRTE